MKKLADRTSGIVLGWLAFMGSHKETVVLFTGEAHLGFVVVGIAQNKLNLRRELANEGRRLVLIGDVGRGELCRQWNPQGGGGTDEMEFPPVPPAMIAGFRPVGFGVNRRMWHDTGRAVFLVPDAALGAQGGAVDSRRMASLPPGL